jgi:sugar lactone lactonase YvrE
VGGVCQPATIASGQIAPFAIAVDPSYIYWTNHAETNGSVVKMPLSGGAPTTMATGLQAPTHITVDTDNVYWTSDDWRAFNPMLDAGPPSGGILMLPLAGGTPITLASGLYSPDWITVSGGTLLWDDWGNPEDSSEGSVSQIEARQGASVVTLATGQLSPTGLAVNATNLYWCNQGDDTPGDGVVFALPRPPAGGVASTLATIPESGMSNPIYLAIDTTHVYWTDFTNGVVVAEPIGGGAITTLAKGVAPYGIAADGTNVYWSDWGNGTVMKVALEGGVITTLAAGQDNPLTIVVDSTRVYWASYNRGTILSIAK